MPEVWPTPGTKTIRLVYLSLVEIVVMKREIESHIPLDKRRFGLFGTAIGSYCLNGD